MDPLTHAISGAALARAFPKQALAGKQVVLLALVAMLPDADVVLRLFSDNIYLLHHRGLTHSLLMLPLWAWLIYSLSSRRMKQQPKLPWLIGAALLLHICLDLITTYGTMILAPVSDWRATLDLVFIIDPLFMACLLIPLLSGLVWKGKRRFLAITGFILAVGYLGLAWSNRQQAIELARKSHPDATAYAALPMAFSPFNWQLIAEYPNHYLRAAVNLMPDFPGTTIFFRQGFVYSLVSTQLTGVDHIHWQELPAMHSDALASKLPGTAFYRWFARYPVLLKKSDNVVEFGDLAFGGGAAGVNPSFLLHIELNPRKQELSNMAAHAATPASEQAQAWLIWRNDRKSKLTFSSAPFDWTK